MGRGLSDKVTQRRERVVELSRQGMIVKQIAKELGCTVRTVRSDRLITGISKAVLTEEEYEERRRRVAALTREGRTAAEIGVILGIAERTVVRDRGLAGVAQEPAPLLTPEELARAEEVLKDGASIEEAARTIGRPGSGGVRRHFKQYAWTKQQTTEFANFCRHAGRCG